MGEQSVAVSQLIHQLSALDADLADAPFLTAVHLLQLAWPPVPFSYQLLHQVTLPVEQAAAFA